MIRFGSQPPPFAHRTFQRWVGPELGEKSRASRIYGSTLAHMYTEDWRTRLTPVTLGDKAGFRVIVNGEVSREDVSKIFSQGRESWRTLEYSLGQFLADVVQRFAFEGMAVYEIANLVDVNLQTLLDVSSIGLSFDDTHVTQTMPAQNGSPGKSTTLTDDRVLKLFPPPWIEGGAGFSQTLEDLLREGERDSAPINFIEKQNSGQSTHFDFECFHELQQQHILKITKESGWTARLQASSKMTEYYTTYRYLRFASSCARLRTDLMQQLNGTLIPKLQLFGYKLLSLELDGLPSSDEIDAVINQLKIGKIGFSSAVSQLKTDWV